MIVYIYLITNLINGKKYVGQTQRTVEERFKEHARANSLIGRVIRKYGKENFKLEILTECENLDKANEMEIYFIKTLDCKKPKGYNLTDGGNGRQGFRHSKKSRLLMSISLKRHYKNPLVHEKLSVIQKKRYENPLEREKTSLATKKHFEEHPETCLKMSLAHKKRYENPTEHEKTSLAMKKCFENPEERKKNSLAQKKRYENPLEHQKTSLANKKHHEEHPETRLKMSESHKKRYKNPLEREKTSLATKKHFEEHPETRLKMSESQKARRARERAQREKENDSKD